MAAEFLQGTLISVLLEQESCFQGCFQAKINPFMTRHFLSLFVCVVTAQAAFGSQEYPQIDQPPHNYWKRPLHDRFSRMKEDLESGRARPWTAAVRNRLSQVC